MTRLVAAFDLDGTLFKRPDGRSGSGSAQDIARQVPVPCVVRRLQDLVRQGIEVHFVSGRTWDAHSLTLLQLRQALGEVQPDRLHLQRAWDGYHEMQGFKTRRLAELEAVLYVGDTHHDVSVAAMSGTPFMHADDFGAGAPLDHLWCWSCGCTALRACVTDNGPCGWDSATQCTSCAHVEVTA